MEINQRDIFIACSVGKIDWLKQCISGCEMTVTTLFNHEGLTPLHVAARNRHNNVLEYLLENCPDIDVDVASLDHGDTPLHSACQGPVSHQVVQSDKIDHQLECTTVRLLLNKGANSNKTNKNAQTPLHIAAEKGLIQVVKLLLSCNADDSITDVHSHTPLDLAKLNGHYESARLLQSLLWARLKDSATLTKIHVQKTLREQMKLQLAMQRSVKEQENQAAYKEWLSNKKLAGVKTPYKCSQRKKERMSSDKGKCQGCSSRGNPAVLVVAKESKKSNDDEQTPKISKIEISLEQADHNILGIGKPEQLYPYTNYPPKHYRKHSKNQNNTKSRPSSSLSGFQRKHSRPASRMSTKSMPTPRKEGSRSPTITKSFSPAIPTSAQPPSYTDYGIHSSNNDIHRNNDDIHDEPKPSLNTVNNSSHDNIFTSSTSSESDQDVSLDACDDEQHEDGNSEPQLDEDTETIQEDNEELEDSGSSSSIDGLTFHEVGPENNLQTLINNITPNDTGATHNVTTSFPSLSATEIVELFRASQGEGGNRHSGKLHRRHSTGGGNSRGSNRFNRFQRTASLNAIPEGAMVTSYTEQKEEGSKIFDEQFLVSLMPYAFGDTNTVETTTDNSTVEVEDNLMVDNNKTEETTPDDPSYNHPPINGSTNKETLKIVTVAWDQEDNEVKTIFEEQKLSPRRPPSPYSPSVTPINTSRSDTSLTQLKSAEQGSTSRDERHRVKSAGNVKKSNSRDWQVMGNGVSSHPMISDRLNQSSVLKTKLYKFGGNLVYTK